MGLERSQLMPYITLSHGFAGGSVILEGMIELVVSFGKNPTKVTSIVQFIVVDQPSAYNSVLGRLTLYAIKGRNFCLSLYFEVSYEGWHRSSSRKSERGL